MIAAAGLDNADFQSLVTGFAGALRKISSDDRSFTYYASAGKQIEVLAEECKRRKVSTIPLLEAYRLYLVTHLSGPRCADDDLMTPAGTSYGVAVEPAAGPAATDALGFFNQRLAAPPLRPIEEQEATPTKLEGLATGLRSCESAGCKAIADRFHSLVFNPVGQAFKPAEKDTPEWHVKLQEFLTAMADWKPGPDESATAHFRERCGLYNDLAAAVPTAADRELTLRALLEFVSRNSVQVNSRIEWFLPVNGLIGRAGLDPVGLARIMDLLRRSSDPVIGLFANLEVLAPRTPDRVLPLL